MSVISFKQRVCNAIIQGASDYKDLLLDYDYLVFNGQFTKRPYYLINSLLTNYLHLTGVHTSLSTYDFYNKSINGTLTEHDFDFVKPGKKESSVKGSVRQKIQALSLIPSFFQQKLVAEEDLTRNVISCSLAASENKITMGFANDIDAKPKTLLLGNVLDKTKSLNVTLVLRRNKGADYFDTIIQGGENDLLELINKNINSKVN